MNEVLRIEAAAALKSDLSNISGCAYSGGLVRQWWSQAPVVIDLAGMKIAPQVALLFNHMNSPEYRLGALSATNSGKTVDITGGVDAKSKFGQMVIEQGRKYSWQLSIGADIVARQQVLEGQTVNVNNQTFTGPLTLVTQSVLREVSIVAVGADPETCSQIAAAFGMTNQNQEGKFPMLNHEPTPETSGGTVERQRCMELAAIFNGEYPELHARALSENWSVDTAKSQLLNHIRAAMPKAGHIGILTPKTPAMNAEILTAAAMLAGGIDEKRAIAAVGAQSLELASKRFRSGVTLQQLILEAAWANGCTERYITAGNWYEVTAQASVKGAYSSISLPGILGNVANKSLIEGFDYVDQSWREIAAIGTVTDFKEVTRYRLNADLTFQKVGADGQLKHGTLGESKFSNQADSYGIMIGVTRQDIINDDLGAITTIPKKLGMGAGLSFNKIFWTEFLNNAAFFTAAAKNLVTTGTALGIEGLKGVNKAFRLLKDDSGALIGGTPDRLLVGPSNEVIAEDLFNSANQIATGQAAKLLTQANSWARKFKPVVSPYLEDETITGNSAAAYYLLGNPLHRAAIEAVFLNGVQTPKIESSEAGFSTLGIEMRAYMDFGCRKQDPKAGVKASGAN